MDLELYYDVACPYAYLAAARAEALADALGARLRWCPVLLGGIYRAIGAPQYPGEDTPAPKAALARIDRARWAAQYGVPLHEPGGYARTVDAMRLCLSAPGARRGAVSLALFRARWVEGRDVADPALLAQIARDHGLEEGCYRDPAVKQGLREATDAVVALGAFGVPLLKVGERWWWGQDRWHFAAQALGADRADAEACLRPLRGGALDRTPPPKPGGRLTFFHDFASPYSYLASTQVARLAAQTGRELEVVPFLLGALFHQIGTPMIPIAAMTPPKQAYLGRELTEWARWWGVGFRWPSTFPLRTVTPLRVSLIAPETSAAIYRAGWVEDLDIGDAAVLEGVLDRAGFDGAALIAGTADPSVKAQLRANTERAIAAGVCGVPTFQIGDRLWWGQDRISQVAWER
jgi:2-hydroxychromene-2-carboxylate isomerase